MFLTFGCTDEPVTRGVGSPDSAELAAREIRRKAFLAEQEAQTRELLRDRRFQAELVIEHPTVMAFFPSIEARVDSLALRQRLSQYEVVATSAGWVFEERHSGRLRLTDPTSHALYSLPVPRDSSGLVLVAPGHLPQVWFGRISGPALRKRLETFRDVLRGAGVERPAGF